MERHHDLDVVSEIIDRATGLLEQRHSPECAATVTRALRASRIVLSEPGDLLALEAAEACLGELTTIQTKAGPVLAPSNGPSREIGPDREYLDLSALPAEIDAAVLIDEFVTSSRERLQEAEAALLALESSSDCTEGIHTVFRVFHTIKGGSGYFGLSLITNLAHKSESHLDRMRRKEIACRGSHIERALASIDCLRTLIDQVTSAHRGEPVHKPEGYDRLIWSLDPASGEREEEAPSPEGESTRPPASTPRGGTIGGSSAGRSPAGIGSGSADGGSVRVRTERLDRLLDGVGELVIAHSMVAQDSWIRDCQEPDLLRKLSLAGKIVRELQGLGLSMRMVPLQPTFRKLARLARDAAVKSGRIVEFETAGEETEIDRHMVDALADPLIHMIRNAVDHGIEPPQAREARGKSRSGRIFLSACHAAGHVVIALSDDGAGLSREQISRTAIAKGLIGSDEFLSDSDLYALIFEPGFSTSETVSEVSGRGVGMDVVRRAITQLQGRIEIASRPGEGTTFTIRLPLTMAVADGMLIRIGTERFILPTNSILMAFRPSAEDLASFAGSCEMVRAMGGILPLIRLHRLFRIECAQEDPAQAILVVLDDGSDRCALMVDELLGQHQVVAKPLPGRLGRPHGVTGGAILGDGRVGLILDPAIVLAQARDPQTPQQDFIEVSMGGRNVP